jgi:hypothetical protein
MDQFEESELKDLQVDERFVKFYDVMWYDG